MLFTHQGASWTDHQDKSGIPWGTDAERQTVKTDFTRVAAWAKENDRPILLGEFGAYDKAPPGISVPTPTSWRARPKSPGGVGPTGSSTATLSFGT